MNRLGLSIAIASAIGLTGCFGGGGGSSSSGPGGATVSGTASKGIIVGGLVSAYLFDENGDPETTAVATATTNSSGDYTLNIPAAHNGKPLYIVVDDNGGAATMKCDIAGGCDNDGDGTPDAAFGEDLDLGDGDLEMTAVLPESTEEVSVNVTPLTTVAAELAKDVISSGTVNDFNIQEAVNNANSQVAERFGLVAADITAIPVVDLTDAQDVADAAGDNAEAIQVAAINAAIISAVQADGTGVSIDEAIETFADDYVVNGLTDNAVSGDVTDLGEILADAGDVIDEVVTIVTEELGSEDDSLTELADVGTDIETDQTAADGAAASDDGDQGTASPTANAENLAQVKAFVEELRELGTAIDGSVVGSGEGAQTVEAIMDNFELQADAADMITSDDAEAAMEGLATAVEAMSEVYDAVFVVDDELIDPTTVTLSNPYFSDMQIPVTVAVSVEGVVTMTVDQEALEVEVDSIVVPVDVNVVGTVTDITLNDSQLSETETFNEVSGETTFVEVGPISGSLDMDVAGTSSYGIVDVTVNEGSVTVQASANVDYTSVETSTSYSDEWDEDATLTSVTLDLDVTIAHNDSVNTIGPVEVEDHDGTVVSVTVDPMTFNGALSFTASDWMVATVGTESNDWSGQNFSYDEHVEDTVSFGVIGLDLSGTFSNSTESFEMAFGIDADGRNVPDWTEIFDTQDGDSETGGEETDAAYATGSITLMFTADLDGVADAVDFSFDVTRTGRDDLEVDVELSYPGRTISVEAQGNNVDSDGNATASLTLTNNDGIVITATGDESVVNEDEEFTIEARKDTDADGDVDTDDTLYAWYESTNGVEIIRYSDGTFESAF